MKNILNRLLLFLLFFCLICNSGFCQNGKNFLLSSAGHSAPFFVDENEKQVVKIAAELFSEDVQSITDNRPSVITDSSIFPKEKNIIVVGTVDNQTIKQLIQTYHLPDIRNKWEHFFIRVLENKKRKGKILLIAGSDARGAAYGIFAISELIGISPWNWWADVMPNKRKTITIPADIQVEQEPSVQYRGIFLNDEDWGLRPWAAKTFEPETKNIGPKTYAKIFELLLRLKANTIWPAMHPGTAPFFTVKGNKETADKYDIVIGTSHAEPMLRNNVGEWNSKTMGDFNYLTNRNTVYNYWKERVQQSVGGKDIYTIGMRGIHDSKMEGASTLADQAAVLTNVFKDQRDLLGQYINKDVTKVPQVFIPYKEVLPVYDYGLKVPDDVTLMWCDDNFGYIRHFPTEAEKQRTGGNGVYYHISYWGAPHDYLWLGTMSPSLIFQQMTTAYQTGMRKMWIVNVGDIKPSEYQMELFLKMAWNIQSVKNAPDDMQDWFKQIFGQSVAEKITPVMQEYYRSAHIRRPELLGNTRVYDKKEFNTVHDLPWSEQEIKDRLKDYQSLSDQVENISKQISSEQKDAYFELVQYPVQAADQMNIKLLSAQLARHGKADWQQSDNAYDSIEKLTVQYNNLKNGKWNYMMDAHPRELPVFDRVQHTTTESNAPTNNRRQ